MEQHPWLLSERAEVSGRGRLKMLVLMEDGRFEGLQLLDCILIAISEWHLLTESSKDIVSLSSP